MALACRACRTPIAALGGCAVCADYKRNLVDDEETQDRPSLHDVAHESIATLRVLIRKAKEDLKSTGKTFYRGADLAMKAGNVAAKVLDAARKMQADGVSVIRSMSFAEKAELFITWYLDLPPPYRAQLRDQMDKAEARAFKPLPPGDDDEQDYP